MLVRAESGFAVNHAGQAHPPIQAFPGVLPLAPPEMFIDVEEETVDFDTASGLFAFEGELGDGNTG